MIKRNQPSMEEVFTKLDETFDSLDNWRSEELNQLRVLYTVSNNSMKKEKVRLGKKYGSDHARVKKIGNRISYNKGVFRELNVEIQRAEISFPDFDLNTWMVHGRVIDNEGNAVTGVTVSLYDNQNNWVRDLGYSCTDDHGYYSLRYQMEPGEQPAFGEDKDLFLTVTDGNYKLLQRESRAFQISIGHIDYHQIVLTADVCTPPEPGDDISEIPPDAWVVRGIVQYEDDSPGSGLTISIYDKDFFFDDVLGSVLTDDAGRFFIMYRTDAFRDLFEKKPDLYLKVLDNRGKQLYSSKKKIRVNVGKVEDFHIVLKKKSRE